MNVAVKRGLVVISSMALVFGAAGAHAVGRAGAHQRLVPPAAKHMGASGHTKHPLIVPCDFGTGTQLAPGRDGCLADPHPYTGGG
jgi:hypothetical protein